MEKTSVIGIDVGTSGCRGVVLDLAGNRIGEAAVALPSERHFGDGVEQSPQHWWEALQALMPKLLEQAAGASIAAIALDATSGSVLLADKNGTPLGPALMYNDRRATAQADQIARVAPRECAAHGVGSGLAKIMWLLQQQSQPAHHILTQCDWLSGMLSGHFTTSDTNNVLRLGYDPVNHEWPQWLDELGVPRKLLPSVVAPGTPIAPLLPTLARRWGLADGVMVCAGTTDSTAAFIASGASRSGEAVTSLGSTLVLKVLADKPVYAPEFGIYSQPLGQLWLVGGGSNSGGAVLRHYFSDEQMQRLSSEIDPQRTTGLNYYPLLSPGERFPFNDPDYPPRLDPRPESDRLFFQGLLEGIARIEKLGYDKLAGLGAPYPTSVRSNGGGARNPAWRRIRAQQLGVPVLEAEHDQACYGAAHLALSGIDSHADHSFC